MECEDRAPIEPVAPVLPAALVAEAEAAHGAMFGEGPTDVDLNKAQLQARQF